MSGYEVPDPLPLRSIKMPPEVSRVEGCDCGGLEWHAAPSSWGGPGCSIWRVPPDEAMAAVEAAHERERAFTAELNRKLREALSCDS